MKKNQKDLSEQDHNCNNTNTQDGNPLVQLIANQRGTQTQLTFDGNYVYTLDDKTSIQMLTTSPLAVPEDSSGAQLGIIILDDDGSPHIAIGLTYDHDARNGTNDFYFYQIGKKGPRSAGSVKSSKTDLSLTFNAGSADGIVVVGTIDAEDEA